MTVFIHPVTTERTDQNGEVIDENIRYALVAINDVPFLNGTIEGAVRAVRLGPNKWFFACDKAMNETFERQFNTGKL